MDSRDRACQSEGPGVSWPQPYQEGTDQGEGKKCKHLQPVSQESTLNSEYREGLWDLRQIKDN